MVNPPPPPPNSRPSRRDPLGFDELIAIFVAFLAIGAILFWGMSRNGGAQLRGWQWLRSLQGTTDTDRPIASTPPSDDLFAPVTEESLGLTRSEIPSTPTVTVTPADRATVNAIPPTNRDTARTTPVIIPPVTTPATPAPVNETPAATPVAPISVPPANPNAPIAFSDVPEGYWAYPFIINLAQRGIISGFQDGTFRPDQPVTRAEYAALLENVLPSAPQQEPIAFGDVPADFWGDQAIDEAVTTGFMRGFPDQTFKPDQPIPRTQVLASLVSGIRVPPAASPDVINRFQDGDQIPVWANSAIAAATASNVVVSYPDPNKLYPNQPATRAEVAAMLYQALVTTGQVQPIESNYIVRP